MSDILAARSCSWMILKQDDFKHLPWVNDR